MPEATPTQTPGLDIPKPHKKDSEVAPEMDPEELKRLKANLATGMNKFRKDQGEKIYVPTIPSHFYCQPSLMISLSCGSWERRTCKWS